MTERIPLDDLNSDQLDQLYDDLDRYEEVVGELNQANTGLARKAGRAETALARVTDLQAQWLAAGPPPLGVLIARWWDARLVELHHAIRPAAEEAAPAATEATGRPTLRERHHAQWLALTDAERAARIAALDEDDEPEQPERTTPDNPQTSSDEVDNPTGAWTPDPPIGCLTVTAERTPSQLPGLRDQLADVTVPLLLDTLPKVIARARGYEVADAVLTLLYREWPWLRAVAEDATPPTAT